MIETNRAIDADGSPRWTWADVVWLVLIGVVGLGLRLGYVLEYAGHPIGQMTWVDEGAYWSRALEILQGRWLPTRPFYQDPLHPYVLAFLIKIAGPSVGTIRIILACLGSLTPVLIFLAGRRGLGRAEGVVAGLMAACYGPLIFTDGLLEKEGLAALLASMALAISAQASTRSRPAWFVLSGWVWGLLALVRANALLVGPLGAVWGFWIARRRRLVVGLVFLVGFVLAILPCTAINAFVGRPTELILTTYQSGANFYIGNGPGATGTYWAPDFVEANPLREADDFEAEAWRRSGRPLSPGQVSRFWFDEGLARWREAPGDSLRLLFTKLGLLMHDFEVPDNQDLAFVRVVAAPRLAWGMVSFGWLMPCAALGLARRNRSVFWWLLWTSTFTGLISTAAFFVVGRYRIPWIPGLALLGGAGLVDVVRRGQAREWGSLAWRILLLSLPIAALAWRPLADPSPDRWGHSEIALAVAELGASRLEPAIDALDDARAFGPGAAIRVGEITTAGPVHDRLVSLIQVEANRLGGRPNVPRGQLARWLRQVPEGRAESRRLLDESLAENTDDRPSLREFGAWFLGDLDNPDARRRATLELERASRNPSGDFHAAILLALLSGNKDILPSHESAIEPGRSPRLPLARTILESGGPGKTTGR